MWYRKKKVNNNPKKEKELSKCWTCQNCYGGCEWSRSFKPVPGWDAEKTFLPANRENAASYFVKECPKYRKDER
jgi:sulfatase maturation enzyme AslB (radical SAM superfamily)